MTQKVFISYSWGTEDHQNWVLNLAKRLMSNGVDVILDKWDLKEGHDIYDFMESMVKSNDISKVLIICDNNYQRKADKRDGGVGTETQIITPEIYGEQKQGKFIPIVIDRDSNNKPTLPIYLSSRKYVDLSDEDYFEENYEILLRNILEEPALKKPKLGQVPKYIVESSADNQTNFILRNLDYQLRKNSNSVNSLTKEFLDVFLENLWNYEFKSTSNNIEIYGDELIDNLHLYKEIREDFISFLYKVTKPEYFLDVDILINFFEKKNIYNKSKGSDAYNGININSDNYKIIFQELYIYTIAICLKNLNYKLINDLLNSGYYFEDFHRGNSADSQRFSEIYVYNRNLELYYETKHKKICGFGAYATANLSPLITKKDFILADTLCHYILDLTSVKYNEKWFPSSYIYKGEQDFDFFRKMASNRHFEKVKEIFKVDNRDALKSILTKHKEKVEKEKIERIRIGHFEYIPHIHEIINIDKIGSES